MYSAFKSKAIQMLSRDEGSRNYPYDDATGYPVKAPLGNLTVGIGHNLDSKPLSDTVIYCILSEDIDIATNTAIDIIGHETWDKLSENRKLALINLAFNMRPQSLRSFKHMLEAIRSDDWETAGKELRDSLWSRQVDPRQHLNQGRDDRVIKLLEKDEYDY